MTTFTSEDRIAAAREQAELSNKLEIVVRLKTNYGQQTIYPVCERAKTFAKMLDQSTLTPLNIKHIKELGYIVALEPQQMREL